MRGLSLKTRASIDLDPAACEAFDRRLRPEADAPLCVAYSGGGDSLMTLLLTKAWADAHGRQVTALCVDHRLQAQGAAWVEQARKVAEVLGVGFQALAWDGPKPESGVAAAARAARHRLLAQAARGMGASVVVLGHTADDLLEAELMRREGSTLGTLREWSPSPAWPQGRGVFLLRPLLHMRRAAIRQVLEKWRWDWIDDPANADPRSPRARARLRLADAAGPTPAPAGDVCADLAALAHATEAAPEGWLRIDREVLRAAPDVAARRWLAAAALSVGGGARPSRGERLMRLHQAVTGPGEAVATLAGAKVVCEGPWLALFRDAGERRRGGLAPLMLEPGVVGVWDGRFECLAEAGGSSVRALAGAMARLRPDERRRLAVIPAAARPALPAVADATGGLRLAADASVRVRSLVAERLRAACGLVAREPAA